MADGSIDTNRADRFDCEHSLLSHDLGPVLERLASIPTRRRLARDPIYRSARSELDRVLRGFEWDLRPTSRRIPGDGLIQAVTWNIERGKRLDGVLHTIATQPRMREADLLLLTEVDIGMGRSGNRNVARELSQALNLGYVYCNMELVLSPGDAFERDHGRPNTLAMHGSTLLTRWPVSRFQGIAVPEYRDKFHADEKRLGGKRALLCEVQLPCGPTTIAVVHLDPFAPPRHRARQMRIILQAIERMGNHRVLLGGDLNTNTYDLGGSLGLAWNVAHKLVRFGFDGTIRHYMTPELHFERGTFTALRDAGFGLDPWNDRTKGTAYYDLNDAEFDDWTRRYVPGPVHRWLRRRLRPWNGCVPLRVDWFAGRGLVPVDPAVVERPSVGGEPVSDHEPLLVALRA